MNEDWMKRSVNTQKGNLLANVMLTKQYVPVLFILFIKLIQFVFLTFGIVVCNVYLGSSVCC